MPDPVHPQPPQLVTPTPATPIRVAVCIPHGRDVTPIAHQDAMRSVIFRPLTFDSRPVLCVEFGVVGDEYARGRNDLVRQVIAFEQDNGIRFDYLWWIDDDVIVPSDSLERLLARRVPVISGLYFMRKWPHLPVAYEETRDPEQAGKFWNITSYPDNDLLEIAAAGMGCALIARDVFDRITQPYFAWRAVRVWDNGAIDLDETPGDSGTATLDEKAVGEDLYFFASCRAAGYRVFLDPTVKCGHLGAFVYDEGFFRQRQPFYRRIPPVGRLAILFLPAPSPAPWDGSFLAEKPLGGSEAMVALIARELALRHHHIVTVAAGTETRTVDGVLYKPHHFGGQLATQQEWDAVVVSRWTDILPTVSANPQTRAVVLWAHDIMTYDARVATFRHANAYVTLTPWHAAVSFGSGHPDEVGLREAVIPNAVDLSLFREYVPFGAREQKLIWTSNPNRGLMSAVRIFRRLRADHPDLTFHVYGRSSVYGWQPGMEGHEGPFLPDAEEPGVFVHDPLPRPELARELSRSLAMLYSSTWHETSSLAVVEAQAAGTPVLAPPLAALHQTVVGGAFAWSVDQYRERLTELYDPAAWERASLRGREFARTVSAETIGGVWDQFLRQLVAERVAADSAAEGAKA